MKIDRLILGPLDTNTYILMSGEDVIIIDPADNASEILKKIQGKNLIGIIVTHYHFDHIGALEELKDKTHAKVYDYKNIKEGSNHIGPFRFRGLELPGHKEDLIGLYFEKENVLFAGDFIFEGTIGRWDLDGGSFSDMQKSINKILDYPHDMKIYPGHGRSTTLNDEVDNLKNYI